MNIYYESNYGTDELYHSGIMGMHWGKRRYQYEDGSLTPLGREHYGVGPARGSKKAKTDKDSDLKSSISSKIGSAVNRAKQSSAAKKLKSIVTNDDEAKAKRKAKIIAKGNPKEILSNMDLFTTEELTDALRRAEVNRKLKDLSASSMSKQGFLSTLGKTAVNVSNIANAVGNVKSAVDKFDTSNKSSKQESKSSDSGPNDYTEAKNAKSDPKYDPSSGTASESKGTKSSESKSDKISRAEDRAYKEAYEKRLSKYAEEVDRPRREAERDEAIESWKRRHEEEEKKKKK